MSAAKKSIHDIWRELCSLIRSNDRERMEAFEKSLEDTRLPPPFANGVDAQLKWMKGDFQEAFETIAKANQKRQLGAHEFLVLGLMELDAGHLDASLEHLKAASHEKTYDARLESGIARIAMARGHFQAAERFFQRSVSIDPMHWHARYQLGTLLERRHALNDALKEYSQVNKDAPHFEEAWLRRAAVMITMGKPTAALVQILPVLKERKKWVRLQVCAVECLKAGGRFDEAITLLLPIARNFNDPHLVLDLVELFIYQGNPSHARDLMGVADAFKGKNARRSFLKGALAEVNEAPEEAIEFYNEALELDPDFWQAADAMGTILSADGPLQELEIAEELYQAAVNAPARPVRPVLNLALVYGDWERWKEAKALIKELLEREDLSADNRKTAKEVLDTLVKAQKGILPES